MHLGANLHEGFTNISKYLKSADVVLMIDEAEHLPLRALEDLRRIWDFSGVPIVLFGTEILTRNLMGKNGELRQPYSRIGGKYKLKGLDKQECEEVFGDGIHPYTLGNFRGSSKLFNKAQRLAQMHQTKINPEIINQAVNGDLMKVPIKKGGKMIWIVLEPSLIAGKEEIEEFIQNEITPIRIGEWIVRIAELGKGIVI